MKSHDCGTVMRIWNETSIAFRPSWPLLLVHVFPPSHRTHRNPFHYAAGTMWLAMLCLVSFQPFNSALSFCLYLSASSRSRSKPIQCRQQGPPQSQVRGTARQWSLFSEANRWSSCLLFRPPLLHRVVLDWAGSPWGLLWGKVPSRTKRLICLLRLYIAINLIVHAVTNYYVILILTVKMMTIPACCHVWMS